MVAGKSIRLSKLAREFNVGTHSIVEHLHKKGIKIESSPNTKVSVEAVQLLEKEYKVDILLKKESEKISLKSNRLKKEVISIDNPEGEQVITEIKEEVIEKPVVEVKVEKEEVKKPQPKIEKKPVEVVIPVKKEETVKILGKIDLDKISKPKKTKKEPVKVEKPIVKEKIAEVKPVKEKPVKEKIVKKELAKKEPIKAEEKPAKKVVAEKPKEVLIAADIPKVNEVKVIGKIDLKNINQKTRPSKKSKAEKEKERKKRQKQNALKKGGEEKPVKSKDGKIDVIKAKAGKLNGPTVLGKIDLTKKDSKPGEGGSSRKKRRRRIPKDTGKVNVEKKPGERPKKGNFVVNKQGSKRKRPFRKEVNEEDVQKQIKDTLARLTSKGKKKGAKYRRDKRVAASEKVQADIDQQIKEQGVLKVTEFVSVAEFATMMDVSVTQVISSCMSLGLFVSINQRLDAETLSVVGEEFGFKVEFVSVEIQEAIDEVEDSEEDLKSRPPIVTVMGHVDHGKTSLLDYIRDTNVIAGEAGGITQHIGAYHVKLKDSKDITFLDTPGHEAFTAMRARGAQVTDIAIIIVAADDNVMPQTVEAINHAAAASVPIVFAINKIDKPGSDPERIKKELAEMNYLVEEWGGKYQSHDISAKNGIGIDELLEKVLLEAEMLELRANANKNAQGTIIESELDKGRGYVSTLLVQSGTLKAGDIVLSGQFYGHVKAMFNERNQNIKSVGPAEPAIILGLNGAPQAGDRFNVMENEREARNISNKREQLAREQGLRTQKHIT
ncbi:MAG: translation initiation factor IF-2, partial [Draconibacterium sp.]|nr:translation initiation factor IF-2 [Draconibacterium sp.]